ncbi:tyrosine-type recombinase/integrase [Patescibacteria group bacterium]|nr:tyrosine-type recombinase/integrase [Patescibacteria group bacterium]MBU1683016.1 tyrosine-type recombinase/integrase [Patescibacteria group bacterium]MBU1935244.1 tyrosine-type recombinase/integrase [Patescibacteria group bacterium]
MRDSYTDFILSRQAILCTPVTIRFYSFTAGKFVQWLENQGSQKPYEINNRLIYAYLAGLESRKLSDSYIHGHARAIRTFVRFLQKEGYIQEQITFKMPTRKKRLLVYNKEEVQQILNVCHDKRDKAFILLMVDSRLRQAEVISLNWGDVSIFSGIVRAEKGKGRIARSVVIGVHTRRALLKYKNEVDYQDNNPLFQTKSGGRFTASGLRSWMLRISERARIHISPHALGRTFATLSLRAGMNVI